MYTEMDRRTGRPALWAAAVAAAAAPYLATSCGGEPGRRRTVGGSGLLARHGMFASLHANEMYESIHMGYALIADE